MLCFTFILSTWPPSVIALIGDPLLFWRASELVLLLKTHFFLFFAIFLYLFVKFLLQGGRYGLLFVSQTFYYFCLIGGPCFWLLNFLKRNMKTTNLKCIVSLTPE